MVRWFMTVFRFIGSLFWSFLLTLGLHEPTKQAIAKIMAQRCKVEIIFFQKYFRSGKKIL